MQIVANNLGRRFGKVAALRDMDFELRPGEIVAVVGDNGAGKTTLLQMLAGLPTPTDGTLFFEGKPFRRIDEMFRRKLVFLPDFRLFSRIIVCLSIAQWSQLFMEKMKR